MTEHSNMTIALKLITIIVIIIIVIVVIIIKYYNIVKIVRNFYLRTIWSLQADKTRVSHIQVAAGSLSTKL